jgi:phage repressor protein C with HTH and peptisase S24 domain
MQRMESTADRLKRLREERGIGSGAELARMSGVPEATYRAYESGRRPLTPRAARELAAALGITWQALLFGKDAPALQGAVTTAEQASALLDQRTSRKPRAPRSPSAGNLPAEIVSMGGDSWALLPVYDTRASAGPGREIDNETVIYRIAFREEWVRSVTQAPMSDLAVIAVDGDSMEPTLRQGDTVLVDFGQKRPQRKDGIYVIRTDGGLQVKRLQFELASGSLAILSDNKAYEPQHGVKPDDLAVVGRVIWLGRQIGS